MAVEPLEQYREDVRNGVISPIPYDRLMIHYRKEKEYLEELKVVKKGITAFKKHFANLQRTAIRKKKGKVRELSLIFSKTSGLTDKRGNEIYHPEPLSRWIKRQATVEQKLNKKKK